LALQAAEEEGAQASAVAAASKDKDARISGTTFSTV
jgi:hypothetical protein